MFLCVLVVSTIQLFPSIYIYILNVYCTIFMSPLDVPYEMKLKFTSLIKQVVCDLHYRHSSLIIKRDPQLRNYIVSWPLVVDRAPCTTTTTH